VLAGFGGLGWTALGPESFAALLRALAAATPPSAEALRAISPLLAPFFCEPCGASYCYAHWSPEDVMDEGFYDCTRGTCPNGHRQLIDD
jgi:hypothetical protein